MDAPSWQSQARSYKILLKMYKISQTTLIFLCRHHMVFHCKATLGVPKAQIILFIAQTPQRRYTAILITPSQRKVHREHFTWGCVHTYFENSLLNLFCTSREMRVQYPGSNCIEWCVWTTSFHCKILNGFTFESNSWKCTVTETSFPKFGTLSSYALNISQMLPFDNKLDDKLLSCLCC